MRVLGIDPGLEGALALLEIRRFSPTGEAKAQTLLDVQDMPLDIKRNGRGEILDAQLAAWIREWAPDHAYIERVHSMPAQGVASTFTFGAAYGVVRGVLAGLAIPTTRIDPKDWMARVRMTKATTSPIRAGELFPAYADKFLASKDGRSDAALIALAGWRELNA